MYQSYRSSSAEFPRQKIYLTSLNQLMERKITLQPQIQVSNKLFPARNFAKKLSASHQRLKSSSQIRTRRFDLHFNSKNSKNLFVQNQRSPTSDPQQRLQRHQSHDIRVSNNQSVSLFNSANDDRDNLLANYSSTLPEKNSHKQTLQERPDSPQKNFLRKGSSLQKQIVVNLLRSKLLKEREMNEKRQYSNHQIIKMIQVFKGISINDSKVKKGSLLQQKKFQKLKQKSKQKRRPQIKDIKGWDHDAFPDYQENQQERQQK